MFSMNEVGLPHLYNITMKSLTWEKDSHELFDYESKSIHQTNLRTCDPCIIFRKENEVNLCTTMNPHPQYPADSRPLAFLFQTDRGLFFIKPVENEQLWLVVKYYRPPDLENGYKLSEGEVIKLGRAKFKVKSMRWNPSKEFDTISSDTLVFDLDSGSEDKICRICLLNETDSKNPMISPCKCSGSFKYIHFNCLVRWASSKQVVTSDENLSFYYWKSAFCEICKQEFPMSINYQGRTIELFSFEKPSVPYLILKKITKERNNSIYVIHLTTKNSIIFGRGHDCELRISDISVSKCHALISFRNGSFYTLSRIKNYKIINIWYKILSWYRFIKEILVWERKR